jgi:hypothetical protein
MAAEGRINVRHEDVFTVPLAVLGVEPVVDFEKQKANAPDQQQRDKETGLRLWAVSVLDPSARARQREIAVKIAAEVQPVPPNGLMGPAEFDGLQVIPYLDQNKTRPRVGIAYRAAGFRHTRRGAAQNTGS